MKFLLLNQAFHPDVMATAQILGDAAQALARRGHEVMVLAGRRAYDDPTRRFPAREDWRGIHIIRVGSTAFGKGAKWRRAADFGSFVFSCCCRLLTVPRPDAVVALTSPPLISFIGACYARLRGARFVYWVMDLNPDEAIAAGWLREGTLVARILHWFSRFSFRHADKIIALDKFMAARIEAKGTRSDRIIVLPPWSHDDVVRFDAAGRETFRQAHGLEGKFVVMYSGNHSPCHPLDTLLAAAGKLAHDPRYIFLFIGGGSEFRRIQLTSGFDHPRNPPGAAASGRPNLRCLPYQPLSDLGASLSAADLHVVVMGDPFVGTVHPCKIYNVLSVGAPILYVGPRPSHLSEVLDALHSKVCGSVLHGDTDRCVSEIVRIAAERQRGETEAYAVVAKGFSQAALLPRLVAVTEGSG